MHSQESGNAVAVALPARLDIQNAAALKAALLPFESEPSAIEIDGSAVEAADTAGLQLLVALVHGRRTAQRDVRWSARSDALFHAVTQLGLGSALEMTGKAETKETPS
jgi:anti-anti-sigma regulatory factor